MPLRVFGPKCFVAGTELLTVTGYKAIELLEQGDLLISRSEHNPEGMLQAKRVVNVFIRVGVVCELYAGGRKVRTTAEHPFYAVGRGWVSAGLLEPGDWLLSHEGQVVPVERVTETQEVTTLYNVEVADFHTYFVGSEEWGFSLWAHNAQYEIGIDPATGRHTLYHRGTNNPVPDPNTGKPLSSTKPEHVRALAEAQGIDPNEIAFRDPRNPNQQTFWDLNPQPGAPRQYRGGRHGSTKLPANDGLESHHMPANSVNGLHPDQGPAIQMEPADHALTASHGSRAGSPAYRVRQQALIKQGRFGEAIQMDIDDIRGKFGTKYDAAIREMLNALTPAERVGLRNPPL